MCTPGYRNATAPRWDPAQPVDPDEAEEFLRLFHQENPGSGAVEPRLAQIRQEIAETGAYTHTPGELAYGARVAWRNSSKCIGRLYWRSLLVRDLRSVRTADGVFHSLVRHLEITTGERGTQTETNSGQGRMRPVITIFAPAVPGQQPARLWNEQLIRYAGYRQPDGTVVGDPRYVEFTEAVTAMGWRGKGDRFDVLPLVIEAEDEPPRCFDLPERAVVEVPLTHPEYQWFAELGLRWHGVPAISNMRLSIGGISYPLAPFNGWYLGTEIGARNLADADRYDQLPVVADRMGLDMSSEATLWRDRALVEINRAVLWSFERAGLRISDHHTESRRFLAHLAKEASVGRETPADWTWIVPPMSASTTPVFHRYYHEADQRPNFYLDPQARTLGRCGRSAPDRPAVDGGPASDVRPAVDTPVPDLRPRPRPRPERQPEAVPAVPAPRCPVADDPVVRPATPAGDTHPVRATARVHAVRPAVPDAQGPVPDTRRGRWLRRLRRSKRAEPVVATEDAEYAHAVRTA